jgi:hypothetical protein
MRSWREQSFKRNRISNMLLNNKKASMLKLAMARDGINILPVKKKASLEDCFSFDAHGDIVLWYNVSRDCPTTRVITEKQLQTSRAS